MSSLRSALEELVAEDLDRLTDRVLEADFAELERAFRTLQAERLRRLAEIDRRRSWARDGFLSSSAWLVTRFRMTWAAVTRMVREAAALEGMPATRRTLTEGGISTCQLTALVRAREAHPDEFDRAEGALVEAARTVSVGELRRALAYWRQALDGPKALEDAEELHWRRHLHVSPTLDGVVRVDGDLDSEIGQMFMTALDAEMDAEDRDPKTDGRSPAQRRADALGELCRRWLDRTDRPTVGGERPHLTVLAEVGALRGEPGSVCETEGAGPVHPEALRRLACDASIARVLLKGPSEPMDVGRRTSVVPAALRRAVVVRDRHCRFPGCERPPRWCDAHHVVHWCDGGSTSLANLVLLCRRHHRMVHEGPFDLELRGSGPVFLRANGEVLEDRASPVGPELVATRAS